MEKFYGATKEIFEKARELRMNLTEAEEILWRALRNRSVLQIKFKRQHPINFFIVDFYCAEVKLIIEVDGEIHFDPEVAKYDLEREKFLNGIGLKVLRFSNNEVKNQLDYVLKSIKREIIGRK
jgi:imidazole glycerol-phosphate synthase subunit HisF